MAWRALLLWSAVAGAVTGAAGWALSGQASVGLVAGLCAGVLTAVASWRMAEQYRPRVELLADAARQLRASGPQALGASEVRPGERRPSAERDDAAGLAREVTAAAESARHASRELTVLRAVIDGMVEGVWITDERGAITQHNTALKEMLFAGRELAGQRPLELVRSPDLQRAVERACQESASSQVELQLEGVRPRTLAVRVSPLSHELKGSAAVFVDVTDLRRLEKVRKDFVANVSHELRTPITAIRGYAETLQQGAIADKESAPRMVDIIHRQSERLSELVEDLLELSRLESKDLKLERVPVELADVAARSAEALKPKAQQRGTVIRLEIPAGLTVMADPRGVEQVLLNLLDNAVKYTRPNGRVLLSAQRHDDLVELSVKDDGAGIEARHLPRLFERFYRVDKGRSRDMGGTGLGLSIVKHLVTSMRGDVRVESTPGVGSTFFIDLPTPRPSAPVAPSPESEQGAGNTLIPE